jgi:YesN/AraC family two-component response regulator
MKLLVAILREKGELKNEKNYKSCTFESSEKTNIVRTIISFMTSNYMQDISLDKISKNMYLSPVYISKIFKEETGDSPINYLIKIRLDKAAQFLQKENEMTIKEISKKVGYDDAYYFSKLFKKHFTISPIEYKKKMQFVERGVNS